jgi:hypothetical protein
MSAEQPPHQEGPLARPSQESSTAEPSAKPSGWFDQFGVKWLEKHNIVLPFRKSPWVRRIATIFIVLLLPLLGGSYLFGVTVAQLAGKILPGGPTPPVRMREYLSPLPSRVLPEPSPSDRLPRIALVGPLTGINGSEDWIPAYNAALQLTEGKDGHTIANRRLRLVTYDDRGELGKVRSQARDICRDPLIVGVIGYVWSGQASAALQVYANCPYPVPTVLIGATADSLTLISDSVSQRPGPFLQMPPANVYQARQVVSALGDTYSASDTVVGVIVVRPEANDAYARGLVESIRDLSRSHRKGFVDWRERSYTETTTWDTVTRGLRARDVVVYVGNAVHAPNLTKGRKPKRGPILIVTDGSVNQALLARGPEVECIWGTFPVGGSPNHESSPAPTFAAFAIEAIAIVEHWAEAQREKGRPLSRREFSAYVQSLKGRGATALAANDTPIGFGRTGRRVIVFDDTKTDWPNYYHTLQVRSDTAYPRRWVHREYRSTLFDC